jgi:hypothetical protein
MKQKKIGYILAGIFVLAIVAYFIFSRNDKSQQITVRVKKGTFPIEVTTTGELFAKSSEKIRGPQGLPQMQIYSVKILKLIQEGTKVDSGAFVAALDQSEITSKMKEIETNRDKALTQLTQRQLDSSLNLRNLRDQQINMKYDLEQKKTIKDQSIYEPPATRRQADIEVEKAERGLEQAQKSYSLQYRKELANLQDATSTYSQAQRKLEQMEDKIKQFNIFAPKKGMVIYTRSWNGRQQEGSTVDTWGDFTVAELPDLSKMISRTYVNEIDISKVKVGQQVRIGIDAFPDKKFTGKVTSVANVGEQLPNSNAKVFEVNILINEFDSIVRPSMTSKNTIVTATIDNVLFAPIETVVSTDSISYVFRKDGGRIVKQQVITGESNDNEFVLKAGVNENDELLLLPPGNADKLKLVKIPPEELKKHEMTPISKTNIKPGEKPKEIQNVAPPPIKYSNVPKKENTVTPFQKVTDAPKSNPKVNSTIKAADPKKDATGSNTINNSKIYNNNVVFRILIATCTKEVSTGSERFAGLPEIRMYRHQQLFEYTIGKESTSAALSGLLKEAKTKGFSDAYIVAFKGDEQITLAEAKKLISEKNK